MLPLQPTSPKGTPIHPRLRKSGAFWAVLCKHPQDGEADFVIAHPDRGVLVVEVKGGTIRRDGKSGRWMTSTSGITNGIADPVEQAKDSKYVLLDRLKLALDRYIVIGHAVAFPDVEIKSTFLGLALPRQIVLDATDLPQLAPWVRQTGAGLLGWALFPAGNSARPGWLETIDLDAGQPVGHPSGTLEAVR